MSATLPSIALIGKMGSGKSTIAEQLAAMYRYQRVSWAAPLKELATLAYGEPVRKEATYQVTVAGRTQLRTGREILQRLGTDAVRDNVDQDFWIKCGINQIRRIWRRDPDAYIVIDDTRFQNEALALKAAGFVLVRVLLPEEVRKGRLGDGYNPATATHPSETETDAIATTLQIWNTADPTNTAAELMRVLSNMVVMDVPA